MAGRAGLDDRGSLSRTTKHDSSRMGRFSGGGPGSNVTAPNRYSLIWCALGGNGIGRTKSVFASLIHPPMSPFIGRTAELLELRRLLNSRQANLVIVEGRRRIGESRLVEEDH